MKRFINLSSMLFQVFAKLFCLFILLLISETHSQTFTVKGNITTADSTPVMYASITFIDESDTTKKYFTITDTAGNYQLSVITNLKDEIPALPQSFELMQNYPNPFSSETNIPYKLNEVSNASVTIYNILGQEVKSFKAVEQGAGIHGITWNGRDDFGKKVSTGVYFYQLLARGETQVKKMIFTVGGGTNAKLNGGVFSYQGLKKERMGQSASGMYTVQIANTESTQPKILFSESANIILLKDTILNMQVEEVEQWRFLGLEDEAGVTAIGVDPINPNIIYAGTMYDFSAGIDGKLFKSTDAGTTWDTLVIGGSYRNILIDPINNNIIYASPRGIIKSYDSGQTWQLINNGIYIDPETRVQSLVMNPKNSKVLYAGTGGFYGGNFYKSYDGGLHWNKTLTDSLVDGVISIAIDPVDTNNIYAGTAWRGIVWKSTDAGATWARTGLGETDLLIHDILIDPDQPSTIYVGLKGVFKTVNGGINWENINQGLQTNYHVRKMQKSSSARLFLVGTFDDDGGVYEYSFLQKLWVRIGIDILHVSYYYSDLKISPTTNNLYYGGKGIYVMKLKK